MPQSLGWPSSGSLQPVRLLYGRPDDPAIDAILIFGSASEMLSHFVAAARMIYFDPPFGTGKTFYLSPYHAPGEGLEREDRVAYDDPIAADDDFRREFQDLMKASHRALCDEGAIVVHLDSNRSAEARLEMNAVFGRSHYWGEWVVGAGVSRDGLIPHRHASFTPNHNVLQIAGRVRSDEAQFTSEQRTLLANSLWTDINTRGHESGYPSEKSPELATRLLEALTRRGDLILEGFAGSAAVSLTALRLGRRAVMADVAPRAIGIAWARLLGWASTKRGNVAMCIAPDQDETSLYRRLDRVISKEQLQAGMETMVDEAGAGAMVFRQYADGRLESAGTGEALPAGIVAAEVVTARSEILRVEIAPSLA